MIKVTKQKKYLQKLHNELHDNFRPSGKKHHMDGIHFESCKKNQGKQKDSHSSYICTGENGIQMEGGNVISPECGNQNADSAAAIMAITAGRRDFKMP